MLLERAKGVRSWRQYASECDISYVQMRKLSMMEQENPPRPKLIRKLADNAFDDVDLEDFLFAAGLNHTSRSLSKSKESDTAIDHLRSLPPKDRKSAEDFIEFLYTRSK